MKITYLLDTNTVSDLTKEKPDEKCRLWLESHRGKCTLSTITLAELRFGIERRTDGKEKSRLERFYDFLVSDYQAWILDFDQAAAAAWGQYAAELEAGLGKDWWKQIDLRDSQIGAIARVNSLIVATRNTKHFPFCRVENPFD